jgi:hypothetical protein
MLGALPPGICEAEKFASIWLRPPFRAPPPTPFIMLRASCGAGVCRQQFSVACSLVRFFLSIANMRKSYSDLNGESVITVPEAEFGTGPKKLSVSFSYLWAFSTGTTLNKTDANTDFV